MSQVLVQCRESASREVVRSQMVLSPLQRCVPKVPAAKTVTFPFQTAVINTRILRCPESPERLARSLGARP
jgi:hypothetical protein